MVRGMVAGVAANMSAILGSRASKKTPRRIDWPLRVSTSYVLSLFHSLFFSRWGGALRPLRPGNAFGYASEIRLVRRYFRCIAYQSASAPAMRLPGAGVAYLTPSLHLVLARFSGERGRQLGGNRNQNFLGIQTNFDAAVFANSILSTRVGAPWGGEGVVRCRSMEPTASRLHFWLPLPVVAGRVFVGAPGDLRPRFALEMEADKRLLYEGAEVPHAVEQLHDGKDGDPAFCGDESQNFLEGACARVRGNNPVAGRQRARVLRRRECFQGLSNAEEHGRWIHFIFFFTRWPPLGWRNRKNRNCREFHNKQNKLDRK